MTRDQLIRMGFKIVPYPSLAKVAAERPDDFVLNYVAGNSVLGTMGNNVGKRKYVSKKTNSKK